MSKVEKPGGDEELPCGPVLVVYLYNTVSKHGGFSLPEINVEVRTETVKTWGDVFSLESHPAFKETVGDFNTAFQWSPAFGGTATHQVLAKILKRSEP